MTHRTELPVTFTVHIKWPMEVACEGIYDADQLELQEITQARLILDPEEVPRLRIRDVWASADHDEIDDAAHEAATEQHPKHFTDHGKDNGREPNRPTWPYNGLVIADLDKYVQVLGRLTSEIAHAAAIDVDPETQATLEHLCAILANERDAKDGTVAVRVPDHPILLDLLEILGKSWSAEALEDPKRASHIRSLLDMMREGVD